MTRVLDASVLANAVLAQPHSAHARSVIADGSQRNVAPHLSRLEVANALWRHVAAGQLSESEVLERLDVLDRAPVEYVDTRSLESTALRLSCALGHPVYDCLYIALAAAEDADLVTVDERQRYAAARVLGDGARLLGSL